MRRPARRSPSSTRDRLPEIDTEIVAVAGANDIATPPDLLRFIAANVARARFVKIPNAAHLAPAEQPGRIADVLVKLRKREVVTDSCYDRGR